jgi:hypothetical protein
LRDLAVKLPLKVALIALTENRKSSFALPFFQNPAFETPPPGTM